MACRKLISFRKCLRCNYTPNLCNIASELVPCTYLSCQAHGHAYVNARVDELRDAVKLLVLTARGLAHRRMSAGALQLSSQEIDIELDESKQNVVKLAAQVLLSTS
jgi:hypothetical protein